MTSAFNAAMRPLLITSGEPAGIGPELCGLLADSDLALKLNRPLVVLGDKDLLIQRASLAGIPAVGYARAQSIHNMQALAKLPIGLHIWHHSLQATCAPGKPSSANAPYVLDLLNSACDASLHGVAAGMVTAPIQKSAISPHWPGFMGHTEYLAQRCGQTDVVMMLEGGNMRVALATTHLPLSQVPQAITQGGLRKTLTILLHALQHHWGKAKPRVLVTGLNPHAGESGDLGHEEINIIEPVIQDFQAQGHDVRGPFPADTLFQPKYLAGADAVLAMYHDQGLPVLKHASFGRGVNISLGLPIVRTSVDHGTALDLAGSANMDVGSLLEAIECAHRMDLCS
ncbi:MAG TPA: 4-hydroxythreonine-4-phosphate dehydrogenase PdxA [Limnobacter sp.]|nr:4-hydroxythreonine-4-phosphate dehydrogenase PdxA [Limnobacter sp.]